MSKNKLRPSAPAGRRPRADGPIVQTTPSILQYVDTALIDDPDNAARETFDEDALNELIASIAQVGLIEPLVVIQTGKRYRVLAGHRRIVACRALKLATVPCVLWANTDTPGEAVTSHENAFREDLNPAEEARYFSNLLTRLCGNDVDKLCARVKQPRLYVEGRLLLLAGCPNVFAALEQKLINTGVATELNKIPDRGRRIAYLDSAINGGATVRMVKKWRQDDVALAACSPSDIVNQPLSGVVVQPVFVDTLVCFVCESGEDKHAMEILYVHRFCKKATLDRVMRHLTGEPDAETATD